MGPLLILDSAQLHHPLPGDLSQVADFDLAPGSGIVEGWIQADWSTVLGYDPTIFTDRNRDQRCISVGHPSFPHGERTSPGSMIAAFLSISSPGRRRLRFGREDGCSQDRGEASPSAGGTDVGSDATAPLRGLRGTRPQAEPVARTAADRAVPGPALPLGRPGRGRQRMLCLRAVAPELESGFLFPKLRRLSP